MIHILTRACSCASSLSLTQPGGIKKSTLPVCSFACSPLGFPLFSSFPLPSSRPLSSPGCMRRHSRLPCGCYSRLALLWPAGCSRLALPGCSRLAAHSRLAVRRSAPARPGPIITRNNLLMARPAICPGRAGTHGCVSGTPGPSGLPTYPLGCDFYLCFVFTCALHPSVMVHA